MKKYLITGGAGFIGSNFIKYIVNKYGKDICIVNLDKLSYCGNLGNLAFIDPVKDTNYSFLKGDICDKVLVFEIFERYKPDYIVNFAAESHVDRSILDPQIFIKTNILGTQVLLDASLKYGVEKFLQISTDEVYGSLGAEGYFTETTPLDPHSPYSASKAGADMIIKSYYDTFKLPINITRCSNNYGPYQFPEKLIPLMINNCMNNKRLPVYGDGKNIRDWLYVMDHCEAIDTVLTKSISGNIFNIGGNNEKNNIDIVKTIIDIVNDLQSTNKISYDLIEYVEDRKGHDRRYAIDASKIKSELGWVPKVTFEEGIYQTVKWYLSNLEWLREVTSGEYVNYFDKMYKRGKE